VDVELLKNSKKTVGPRGLRRHSVNRSAFLISFLLMVNTVVFMVFNPGMQLQINSILLNLGVEILGIFVAILLVERYCKRDRTPLE